MPEVPAVEALGPVEAPLLVEAVVLAVGEGEALVDFPVAAPAVITTGKNVMSCALNVAVAREGTVPVTRSGPFNESVHTA